MSLGCDRHPENMQRNIQFLVLWVFLSFTCFIDAEIANEAPAGNFQRSGLEGPGIVKIMI